MRVAVIGGTGVLGSLAVAELAARGDAVRAVSRRRPPAGTLPAGVEHLRADLESGEGLPVALEGVEALLDASQDRRRAREVLVEGTRRLGAAAADAGVRHHVVISIVGCDRVPMAYYGAKLEQEHALASGTVPWSLLRATQFHELLLQLFAGAARRRLLPTGRVLVQSIDAAVVARRLADVLHAEPAGRVPDLAGPELRTLAQLAGDWRAHDGRRLLPLPIPSLGRTWRAIRDGGLTDPAAAVPGPTFAQWLAAR